MRTLSLLVLAAAVLTAAPGCAHKKPKGEAHVYGENAPSLHFSHEQERAGGALRTF